MMMCLKCERPATWEFSTATSEHPEGVGFRPFCDEHAEMTRTMIENSYRDEPRARRIMLSRLQRLVSV